MGGGGAPCQRDGAPGVISAQNEPKPGSLLDTGGADFLVLFQNHKVRGGMGAPL